IGPVQLPLGGLLDLTTRLLQGCTVSGSIQLRGSVLTAYASYKSQIWSVQGKVSPDGVARDEDEKVLSGMARDLAYEMLATLTNTQINDPESFRKLVEGLEAYRSSLRSLDRDLAKRQAAREKFEESAQLDPHFALAYYNLGLLLRDDQPSS